MLNRHGVICSVAGFLRRHEKVNRSESDLLRDPASFSEIRSKVELEYMQEWSLYDDHGGFASKVAACFDDTHLSSDEYEDLLARQMYGFNLANPGPDSLRQGNVKSMTDLY